MDDRESTSLASLINLRATQSPEQIFLEDARSDRSLTFSQLRELVDLWVSELARLRVPSGGAVLLAIRDPLCFAIVHLAVIASGRRSVPLNPDLPDGEPDRTAELIGGASLVVFGPGIAARRGAFGAVSVDNEGRPAGGEASPTPFDGPGPLEHGGAAVLFTSGSTGTPKGVELPEAQLLFVAREVVRNNRLEATDRGYNSLPLFHVNAEVVALLASLVAGSTIVLDDAFHRTGFWELLASRRITWLNAVPAILAVLARSGDVIPHTELRFIRSASAPLPDAVRDALGDIPLVLSWGMTEGASQITATPLGHTGNRGSVGRPLGSEVEVRSADGGPAPQSGEIGALWIRGPGVIRSYLFGRAPERFDSNGWLETGDLGWIDEEGFVYLAGRSDDVINRGGEKVYPAELEEVLLGDERVQEAVVVARPDVILGFVPVAYVIRAERGSIASGEMDPVRLASDLGARCEAELPRFKRPAEIIVVDDLPRAPTGKVQRSRVRELAAK